MYFILKFFFFKNMIKLNIYFTLKFVFFIKIFFIYRIYIFTNVKLIL